MRLIMGETVKVGLCEFFKVFIQGKHPLCDVSLRCFHSGNIILIALSFFHLLGQELRYRKKRTRKAERQIDI